ncbi:MATE family efflux transporter [Massilimicrobiota sp. An134]|uniref:MATE family efflux transporter n=1 Tax=Massilimicrobiota sp. An134 TaxID=1965557 RepID=UPI000B37DF81|nr:MATE family efflux transporter [Massilimicrobiota sp. An134]OUQ26709.1 MATE family efflux transporter [Massilimicrobiota sp. An134]
MKLKMSQEVDLGKEPIGHLLFILAVPAITSQVVNALYNMVDRMYIGHIPEVGSAALTGVGVCFPIIMIISAFAYLFGMGGAPRASIFMGKKDNDTAEKILGNCTTSLMIIAVLLTVLVLIFQEPLLYLFGASENTIGYAIDYMTIYAIGTIFVQLTLGLNAFISAQGFSKISMLTVVIGAVTNIVLDPIFIFGLNMGVQGAAVATVMSQALSAIWAFWFLSGKNTILKLKRENLKINFHILLPCIALGVAPFAMQATESVLVLCFNSSLLKYGGDLAVGAMTILSSVMQFAMLPLQGLTQGGQPIISYNYGAKQGDRVQKAFKLQTISCFSYSSILWLLIMIFPSLFVAIFTSDPQLTEITIWALRIYMAGVLLMGIQISCQQTFIAFGNSKKSAFLAVFRKILVLIPLIYILPMFISDQVFAVFLAEPIADTIAVLTTSTMFYFEMKNKMKEMQTKQS